MRVSRLTVIVTVFLISLVSLILLHRWSQTKAIVPPIEILLDTLQGPYKDLTTVSQEDVTVYVPLDATDLEGTISITLAGSELLLAADDTGWMRPRVVNVEFSSPNGTPLSDVSFDPPLEICFKLTREEWRQFLSQLASYEVQYLAAQTSPPGWAVLPQSTHPDRRQLCGQTTHLSLFSLAKKMESPVAETTPTLTATAVGPTAIQPVATQQRRRNIDPTVAPPLPSPTNKPPTATNPPPTATNPPPTATNPPPTATKPPPTATNPPPTATNPPPTATRPPPTATNPPPTATNPPPTATNPPPTPTNPPPPTATDPPPPTNPPPTDPPPTDPPPTDPPPTDPPPTEPPPPTDPPPPP